jgi:hypothetical protein
MHNNPFSDLIGTGSAQGSVQGGYEHLFNEYRPKAAPKKKKDFWLDQLSTGGGIGGALAGAAGGAAIGSAVPVIGTAIGGLIGGVLGGAAGSGGGQVAENAISGEKDLGKGVAQEALIGGITSAPPIRLLRGAGAAGKALIGGARAGEGVAAAGAKAAFEKGLTSPGVISKAGAVLRGEGRGIGIGDKVAGSKLLPSEEQALNKFIETRVKPKGLTAAKQLSSLESFITKRNSELSKAITSSDRALTTPEKNALTKTLNSQFGKDVIGQSPRQKAILDDITTRIKQSKTVADLDVLRKTIDGNINFARNAASPEPAAEQIFKLARTHLTEAVADRVGAAKSLKSDLSNAFRAQELLLNKAGGGGGYARAGSGGIATIPIPRRATQATETAIGKGMGLAGKEGGGFTPTAVIARNALERPVASVLQGGGQLDQQQPGLDQALMQQSPGQFGGQDPSMQQSQQQDPYPRENLIYDMQRDPANAEKYLAYYQNIQDVFGAGQQKPLSSTATKDVSNATVGLQALDQIQSELSNDPGLQQRQAVSSTFNPFGLVSGALGTGQYENARAQARDVIARIRTGAALTNDEAKAFDKFLPQPGDDAGTIQSKLGYLRNQFQMIAGQQGGGTTLEDALMQRQQGGLQ